MNILGISAFYHDSAAVLLRDGRVIAAAEEERFTRIKHDNQFPFLAIEFCLRNFKLNISNIDFISYYEKPLLKFERILETFVQTYPFSLEPFVKGVPEWLSQKIKVEHIIRRRLSYKGKIFFIPHHLSHAAASYYPSPFSESAIATIDGVGEYQTTGIWRAEKNQITHLKSIYFPHSLGLLYSTFTSFLGFRVNEDEYKVMGLAAHGKPVYMDKIYQIIDVKDDGSFELDMEYFSYRESFRMWSSKFEKLFGNPRPPREKITQYHKNIAASIQKLCEEMYFKILNHLYQLTKLKNLCMGGGVALNAVANGKIYRHTPFKNVYIFGPSGDSGAAAGAALYTYHGILKKNNRLQIANLNLGSSYNNNEVEQILKAHQLKYHKFIGEDQLVKNVAQLLAQNSIVGWFQGEMEFGPRALGARSILASPKDKSMKDRVNKIKERELFRPFACSILQEKVHQYFEIPFRKAEFPFMNFCFKVKREKREELLAIVHEDDTCRIQTVNKDNGVYYKLIKQFYALTSIPCLLNTSFNLKGEPIVENPHQAIEDFLKTKLDYIVIGKMLISKN